MSKGQHQLTNGLFDLDRYQRTAVHMCLVLGISPDDCLRGTKYATEDSNGKLTQSHFCYDDFTDLADHQYTIDGNGDIVSTGKSFKYILKISPVEIAIRQLIAEEVARILKNDRTD